MAVLVTGGAGFIGTNLILKLREQGEDVLIVDILDETLYGANYKLQNLEDTFGMPVRKGYHSDFGTGLKWLGADICDLGSLKVFTKREEITTIYHLAALAGVRPSLEDPLRYSRYNVEGTVAVLELAKLIGARVVFASSSSIYGELISPFKEDTVPTEMVSPYAVSKRQGELLMDYYAREWGVDTLSMRFFTVYGPRGRPDMFIREAIRKVECGETLTLYGDGTSYRDYTYVDDIVVGLISAGAVPLTGAHIFNLGAGKSNSLLETVRLIGKAVGKVPVVEHIEYQKGDVPGTLADITKARKVLGYDPQVDLEEGIKRTVEWLRNTQ